MSVFVLSAIVNIADQSFCIPFYGKESMSKNSTHKSAPTKERNPRPMAETPLQAPARVFQEEDAALKNHDAVFRRGGSSFSAYFRKGGRVRPHGTGASGYSKIFSGF